MHEFNSSTLVVQRLQENGTIEEEKLGGPYMMRSVSFYVAGVLYVFSCKNFYALNLDTEGAFARQLDVPIPTSGSLQQVAFTLGGLCYLVCQCLDSTGVQPRKSEMWVFDPEREGKGWTQLGIPVPNLCCDDLGLPVIGDRAYALSKGRYVSFNKADGWRGSGGV
ncbi:hypothetical protein KIPB_015170, partial [Kipferlia bialata]|eukprot:g15170.t1